MPDDLEDAEEAFRRRLAERRELRQPLAEDQQRVLQDWQRVGLLFDGALQTPDGETTTPPPSPAEPPRSVWERLEAPDEGTPAPESAATPGAPPRGSWPRLGVFSASAIVLVGWALLRACGG